MKSPALMQWGALICCFILQQRPRNFFSIFVAILLSFCYEIKAIPYNHNETSGPTLSCNIEEDEDMPNISVTLYLYLTLRNPMFNVSNSNGHELIHECNAQPSTMSTWIAYITVCFSASRRQGSLTSYAFCRQQI